MHAARAVVILAYAVVAAVLLASCGGGAERTPSQQVRDVLSSWFTTHDVDTRCERDVTARFVREVYGDESACRRAEEPDEKTEPLAGSIEVGRPALRGDRGAVRVELHHERAASAAGRVELAREGSRWRIDALGADLLRELFIGRTIQQVQMTAERPGLRLAVARQCVVEWFAPLPADEMRRLGYAVFGQRPARERMVEPIIGCLNAPRTGPQGMSYLRWHLIEDTLRVARDTEEERCIRTALAERLSDDEILEHVQRDGRPVAATRKLARLVASCRS